MKLNFGCGTNKIAGWSNYDIEVNITKTLPFQTNYAEAIFAEHVVEHVTPKQALAFFEESLRVLRPGGLIRICVPSIEKINQCSTQSYEKFCYDKGWSKTLNKAGAIKSIICCHGHESAWSTNILKIFLETAGFINVEQSEIHTSKHEILKGTNGHHTVIGEHNNDVESIVVEGQKPA